MAISQFITVLSEVVPLSTTYFNDISVRNNLLVTQTFTEINTLIGQINSTLVAMNTDADTATTQAGIAVDASSIAVASAHFMGTWTNETTVIPQTWLYAGVVYMVLVAGDTSPVATPSNWYALSKASGTTFTPTGGISATTVQAAIAELDIGKAPKASPVFTGNVSGLGVATGTSFNSITGLATVAPIAPAVVAVVGVSPLTARQDHAHPTNFTSTATDIKMNGTQAVGTLLTFPRADHVHPTDTTRAPTSTIGSLGTQGASGVSFTLTQAHAGKMQVATAAITFTLPTINTITSGSIFILKGAVGISTIALNGNTSELTRLTIQVGEVVALQSDSGTYYRLLYRSSEYSSNMSANGYSYLPNGLLMQWGTYSGSITAGGVLNVTFPTTFPVNVFYSNVAVVAFGGANVQAVTPTCVATTTSNLSITNNDVDSSITQLRWFSIGN